MNYVNLKKKISKLCKGGGNGKQLNDLSFWTDVFNICDRGAQKRWARYIGKSLDGVYHLNEK